jgi:hypothetical protein
VKIAFKEWAIVVDALGRGEQTIILRKGGIAERRGGFRPEHERFLLFPTLFHQQRESVVPAAQIRHDTIAPGLAKPEILRLEFTAEVVFVRQLHSLGDARRLRPFHIWRDEVVADRFDWGRDKSLYVMVVRIRKLPRRIELPMLPAYGGCKSWIETAEEIPVEGTVPVLSDDEFSLRLAAVKSALA